MKEKSCGINCNERTLAKHMELIDEDGSGSVDWLEFVAFIFASRTARKGTSLALQCLDGSGAKYIVQLESQTYSNAVHHVECRVP